MDQKGMQTREAETLHAEARDAGARGDYAHAIALLTKPAALAPDWPYPIHDPALTRLLMKEFDSGSCRLRQDGQAVAEGILHRPCRS